MFVRRRHAQDESQMFHVAFVVYGFIFIFVSFSSFWKFSGGDVVCSACKRDTTRQYIYIREIWFHSFGRCDFSFGYAYAAISENFICSQQIFYFFRAAIATKYQKIHSNLSFCSSHTHSAHIVISADWDLAVDRLSNDVRRPKSVECLDFWLRSWKRKFNLRNDGDSGVGNDWRHKIKLVNCTLQLHLISFWTCLEICISFCVLFSKTECASITENSSCGLSLNAVDLLPRIKMTAAHKRSCVMWCNRWHCGWRADKLISTQNRSAEQIRPRCASVSVVLSV